MQTRHTTGDNDRVFAAIVKWRREHALQQCLADGESCPGRVIRAHSVQRAYIMEYLARSGHVYMFQTTGQGHQLSLIGQRTATTFTGFCTEHDLHLFREVDFDNSRAFDPASPRQVVLLALRAAALEYWLKLNNQKLYQRLVELGNRADYESLRRMLNLENADAVRLTLTWEEKWKPSLLGTKVSLRRIQRLFRSLYQQVQTGTPAFIEGLTKQTRGLLEDVFSATIHNALPYKDVPDISLFGDGKSNFEQSTA